MSQKNISVKMVLLLGVFTYVLGAALFTYSWSPGPNYRNVSVDTTVNITNSLPEVLNVLIEGGSSNITLNAGFYRNVTCNATIRDYNGGSTIDNVSATFYHNTSSNDTGSDDNNSHYTVSNCTYGSFDTYTRNVSCSFLVQYYANAGPWVCNVTATDPYNFSNVSRRKSGFNSTYVGTLLALNVTPLIDYGSLAVGDQSDPQQANVTNFGNQNINISVRAYGNVPNDGLAMYCQFGNISVENEKFNVAGGTALSAYTNASNSAQVISGLTVLQQTNDSQPVINTTYWILYVPPNPFGRCNGTVVFQAESS